MIAQQPSIESHSRKDGKNKRAHKDMCQSDIPLLIQLVQDGYKQEQEHIGRGKPITPPQNRQKGLYPGFPWDSTAKDYHIEQIQGYQVEQGLQPQAYNFLWIKSLFVNQKIQADDYKYIGAKLPAKQEKQGYHNISIKGDTIQNAA